VPRSFAIVGPGKVGSALAKLLCRAGYRFIGAAGRRPDSARRACEFAGCGRPTTRAAEVTREAELVFITTPDDAIATVCLELAQQRALRPGAVLAHCSGALASEVLAPARGLGASVGSMHPLQSFATAEQAVQLMPGSFCCIEGDEPARGVLHEAALALGARAMSIPTEGKALYHAAAVVSCNYLVALQNAALKLAQAAGLRRAQALEALLPLIRGTVNNMERLGIPECLTGPIARGDVETVRRHLRAIESQAPSLLPLYRTLGLETVEVALAKGSLTTGAAEALRRAFRGAP